MNCGNLHVVVIVPVRFSVKHNKVVFFCEKPIFVFVSAIRLITLVENYTHDKL